MKKETTTIRHGLAEDDVITELIKQIDAQNKEVVKEKVI